MMAPDYRMGTPRARCGHGLGHGSDSLGKSGVVAPSVSPLRETVGTTLPLARHGGVVDAAAPPLRFHVLGSFDLAGRPESESQIAAHPLVWLANAVVAQRVTAVAFCWWAR